MFSVSKIPSITYLILRKLMSCIQFNRYESQRKFVWGRFQWLIRLVDYICCGRGCGIFGRSVLTKDAIHVL